MQFYNEFIDNNDNNNCNNIINKKLINIDNNYFYKNDDEIIINVKNNRGIHDDIVYINIINNEVVGIKERMDKKIVGILYLDSKIKYGFFKDKMLYLFKSTNKKYSDFYIPYKGTYKNKIYVTIEFKEWKITDKLPIGTLLDIIGEVGNEEVEYEHLRNHCEIKNNVWKLNNETMIKDNNILKSIEFNIPDYKVFSIDPIGSKDIDDAFHYINLSNNTFEIGIHIASPYKFFENNLDEILNRVSTVYLPNKKYNMLPNIYADNYLSLLEGKNRFSLSLIFKINRDKNEVECYELKETVVKNIKNYNYDEFNILICKNKGQELNKFMNDTKLFFNKNNDKFDSHNLVEEWMCYTNKFIANYLIKNIDCKDNIIVRVLNKNNNILINTLPYDIKDYLNIKNENSALYELYDENKEQYHYKLNNEYYTHYTSPIRRSIDLFIHGLIINKRNIMDKTMLQEHLIKINVFTKQNRKFGRQLKRLQFLYENKNREEFITSAYIIDILENRLKIYLPEYNLEEKIILIPYAFKNLIIPTLQYNDINNNSIESIEYIVDNKKYFYKLYDKIDVKIWIFTTMDNIYDKLKLEII